MSLTDGISLTFAFAALVLVMLWLVTQNLALAWIGIVLLCVGVTVMVVSLCYRLGKEANESHRPTP